MSRRSTPPIDPSDLRDHADEARIERVWGRIERDLAGYEAPAHRRPGLVYLAIAASFAAFAGGLVVGKAHYAKRAPDVVQAIASIEKTGVEVLAAGSEGRSFELPGGGRLMLSPGATVEVDRDLPGGGLTLKLVQGEASIDTSSAKQPALAIVAGDARLNTQAGSVLSVRRNQDDLDVAVTDGSVSISSPAGSRKLGRGERMDAMPIHTPVAVAPVATQRPRVPVVMRPRGRPSSIDPVAGMPNWLARHNANDYEAGYALLKQQPGGIDGVIASARSATELMAIRDLAANAGDSAAVMKAITRVVDSFSTDPLAPLAANYLAAIYEKAGQADRALEYKERSRKMAQSADGMFCNQIKAEANKAKAAELAKEYLGKYPNGQCKEDIQRMLQGDEPAVPGEAPPVPAP